MQNAATIEASHQPTRSPRRRRGAALMMVLSVVAAGSILSWAMLTSAAVRSQVDGNAVDSLDAGYIAESGVSYALYYLRYPSKSPVALTTGTYDSFYGGENGLRLWDDARGTADLTVTNTASNQFKVRSTAVVNGTRRTVEADVVRSTRSYQVTSAGGFNGPFTVPSTMTISGPVVVNGTMTGSISNVSGTVTSSSSAVVPVLSDIALISETGNAYTGGLSTDRTYTYNGVTYAAEKIPTTTVTSTLQTLRPSLNPKNVWYSDSSVTFNGVTMTGTVVMRNSAPLVVTGTTKITAGSGMPAIIATKQIELKQQTLVAGKLTVNGVAWVAEKILASGTMRSDGSLTVNGALLMGGSAPTVTLMGASPASITYTSASATTVENLSISRTVDGVEVARWRFVD